MMSKQRQRYSLLLGVALVAAVALVTYCQFRVPPPKAPAPVNLDKLDPQLREYVVQKLEWVRQRPRRADRHATLGLVYAVNGLWQEARVAFENAARLDPKNPLPHMYVGVAAQELGELNQAVEIFRELISKFPSFPQGYYRLGAVLPRTGALDEAETAFRRLIELAPDEWRGFAGLGEVELRKGRHAEAAQHLERAVQLDFNAKTAHHLLGQAYRSLGRPGDAE